MSGLRAGRRRERHVIAHVALPGLAPLKPGDEPDTRTDRALADLQDAVNAVIDVVQGNIDLGNLDP